MSAPVPTLVHSSCFPSELAGQLRRCLQERAVDPKFHYSSYAQARSWRRLHEQYAPSRHEDFTRDLYEQAYRAVLPGLHDTPFQLLGLGCGHGQKEARFLEVAAPSAEAACYLPLDISLPLVIDAYLAGRSWAESTRPIVCDLAGLLDLPEVVAGASSQNCQRVITLFGLLPQLDPGQIFSCVRSLLRPGDQFLFSANLVPPGLPQQRLEQILKQYDNEPTREWLMLFLRDLGIDEAAGRLEWTIEEVTTGELFRLGASFLFVRKTEVEAAGETFSFHPAERLRLFYSYRYTPEGMTRHLSGLHGPAGENKVRSGAILENSWRSASGEEGLYHLRVPA